MYIVCIYYIFCKQTKISALSPCFCCIMNNTAYIIYAMIFLHTKFQVASDNHSLIIANKRNAKYAAAIFLFYILQNKLPK